MSRLIDLSQTIEDSMPVFPGDSPLHLFQNRHLDMDHYNDHRLEISMHSGTHIDGPMHLTESQEYVSDLPLESFIGPGCLLDVRGQPVIAMKSEYEATVKPESIVLLFTGQAKFYGQPAYFESYPAVDPSFGDFIIKKHIKLLGLDSSSPDYPPYSIHKSLLRNEIYILENLTNLDKLVNVGEFEIIALPLNIKANGSMARVIARIP